MWRRTTKFDKDKRRGRSADGKKSLLIKPAYLAGAVR